jgi:hypothetical protein
MASEVSQIPLDQLRSVAAPDVSMFGGNNLIQGGTFVQSNSNIVAGSSSRSEYYLLSFPISTCLLIVRCVEGFELLQKRVATSAFHDSAQRADPPRCHPNTRDAVIQEIFDWMVGSRDRDAWLMWLNGAAGAGKSAIAQSIAERCVAEGHSVASFFFSRWDKTRNTMASLVATLAYQIIQAIPTTLDDIIQTIEQNPLIFEQSLESQFESLIIQPLLRMAALPETHGDVDHALRRLIVIIDGLDECDNRSLQCSLIKLLGNLLGRRNLPIVFLVCSRAELHLQMAFEQQDVTKILAKLPLDDVTKTSDGIRVYLNDKFAEIKQIHPFRGSLADWPDSSIVEQIIAKSSGQFIYASVVMCYISFPSAHPAIRLDIINGIRARSSSSENPFANLDALYEHIFSEVQSLNMTLDILAYALLGRQQNVAAIEWAFGLAPGEVEVSLADLTSVITCKPKDNEPEQNGPAIRFLHASLPDFLLDQSRSAAYHINPKEYCAKLACILLKKPLPSPVLQHQRKYLKEPLLCLLQTAKASSGLYKRLRKFDMAILTAGLVFSGEEFDISLSYALDFLYALKNLDLVRKTLLSETFSHLSMLEIRPR